MVWTTSIDLWVDGSFILDHVNGRSCRYNVYDYDSSSTNVLLVVCRSSSLIGGEREHKAVLSAGMEHVILFLFIEGHISERICECLLEFKPGTFGRACVCNDCAESGREKL